MGMTIGITGRGYERIAELHGFFEIAHAYCAAPKTIRSMFPQNSDDPHFGGNSRHFAGHPKVLKSYIAT